MFWKSSTTRALSLAAALSLSVGVAAATPVAGDFTLDGPDGPVSLSDLRGKTVLIFFGYTSCPDVCPISLARINACFSAMDNDELERVQALFITLDPERDTALETACRAHPDLRGAVEDIDAVTAQYGITYSKDPMPGSPLGYSVSHPTDILLLDESGAVVETVPHDTRSKDLLARIRDLMKASD